jgi:hypothetical protein
VCPAYDPGHECAYELPVQIRTKDQLGATLQTVLEMQFQRAMFARFAEEAQGGHTDAAASEEFDRLFRLSEKFKDIMDDTSKFSVSIEASGNAAEGGALTRIFGKETGEQARTLEEPIDADAFVSKAIEGELVTKPEDQN